ncbi:ABC transporter ATP-binding protein [Candidatus Cryosericum hinesii]|uniref:ABC transporter ATP-binding protein n=1 Tax=Candidatus Cryosericum hinesii TaxID=2290915 RepID=A0A398DRR7_9BACT|nr:ABC transporter ATP-binding protein [Candidatus Cryosericum hinesii]RIE14788.1 ABC transporter ATP-binding protein [Candidatus Cryosericum hinesii]RIE15261.1 ABC transporter ATP-binding protein [Candidatus Cryosericum hinesii]
MFKIYRNLKQFTILIIVGVALMYLSVRANLELPTLMSNIVDKGIIAGDTGYIWKEGGIMLLISAAGGICAVLASLMASRSALGLGKVLRSKIFTHVENFSLHEFDKFGASTLLTRTTNDVVQVQTSTVLFLTMIANALFTSVGAAFLAYAADPKLTRILYVALPVIAVAIVVVMRLVIPLFGIVQTEIDKITKVVRENLIGIRVIRAFDRIDHEKARFDKANADVTNTYISVNRIMAGLMPLMMLVMNGVTIAIIWFGSERIATGNLTLGPMLAFMQYALQILIAILMLTMLFIQLPRSVAASDRIMAVLETHPEITDAAETLQANTERGYVTFQDVTFSYDGGEEPALCNISFDAKPGETTAIIGSTGSGKTTLVSLIPRFYDVDSGKVLVDGVDVRELSQEDLRHRIGFVPQKAVLFTGTVADNIRYGKEDATDMEVAHAADVAQAAEFITTLPDGYATMLSEGGLNLSGGQKQRLAMARALVRRPEIYVFDDSFSALDFKTDANLRAALKKETLDATVIIVAQRVGSIMNADRIIVLDEGKVAGIGTHKELMKTCEVYREIVYSQLSEEELA